MARVCPEYWLSGSSLSGCSLLWVIFQDLQIGPTKTAPLLINTIEMRVFWTGMKYNKSASRLLDRAWVNKGGLDL